MAALYLAPEYTTDILISYSHGDFDATGQSKLKTWAQLFKRELEAELRQEPDFRNVAVFLDENPRVEQALDPAVPLTAQLKARVESAALLTVLMSPDYLSSQWCKRERDWWLSYHRQNSDISGRVFVARVLDTDHTKWPAQLADEAGNPLIGFWFHPREDSGAPIRPYCWDGRTDDRNQFVQRLLDMVGALMRRLRTLREQVEARERARAEADRLSMAGGQVLYLYAREADHEAWSRSYREVSALGYAVTPAAPEPRADGPQKVRELTEERVNQLVLCDALLLLGAGNGFALDADMLSIGRQSRYLARARSGKLLPCAILDTSGGQLGTVERLGLARTLGITWIEAGSNGWPDLVREWLNGSTERLDMAA